MDALSEVERPGFENALYGDSRVASRGDLFLDKKKDLGA